MSDKQEFRTIIRFPAKNVRSLVWEGNTLVDWVSGGIRYELDGTILPRPVNYAFRFDAACGSPSGSYAVIYERLGTKGLVLRSGEVVREIGRSYYQAHVYEFPVCIAKLASGQEVLIYCPDEYNRLEIEDMATGERLTNSDDRTPFDFFHSRLTIDPSNTFLLSAGWVWHPFDAIGVYQLNNGITDPKSLDESGMFKMPSTEISSAAFIDNGHLLISTSDESFLEEDEYEDGDLRPNSIVIWDILKSRIVSQVTIPQPVGTLMPVGSDLAVEFFQHPTLFDIRTGKVVAQMSELDSGNQVSSIIHHLETIPALALDQQGRRFALATDSEIVVVEVSTGE